jgi:Fe2+ transport system protein FeoA
MEDLDYTLADMDQGEVGTIQEIRGGPAIGQRLVELGFIPGVMVRFLGSGLGGTPVRVELDGRSTYALRREEAKGVILT